MVGLISGLANTAVNALKSAGKLTKSVNVLASGSNNLKVAFLGAGILFMVMVLLVMSINLVGGIRRDEAKQYLDNILVAPHRRTNWLMSRLLLAFSIVMAMSLLGGLALYAIAGAQHISLNFWKVAATCICAVGSVGFLIGLGALLYGLAPRLAVIALYAVISWSFIITLVASADTTLNTALLRSSLFHYTNFNLGKWPDWATFAWMVAIGGILSGIGIVAFNRRDIIPE
jgi:putative exporter of polyketide antibiotics